MVGRLAPLVAALLIAVVAGYGLLSDAPTTSELQTVRSTSTALATITDGRNAVETSGGYVIERDAPVTPILSMQWTLHQPGGVPASIGDPVGSLEVSFALVNATDAPITVPTDGIVLHVTRDGAPVVVAPQADATSLAAGESVEVTYTIPMNGDGTYEWFGEASYSTAP